MAAPMAAPDSFTSTQARMREYCEWVTGKIENDMPTRFADQNKRIREYMGKMQEYWTISGEGWRPEGIEDVSSLGAWIQDSRYKRNFDQEDASPLYRAIADNVWKMQPVSGDEESEYSVAEQLINRNEWFNRSIICITAGAVAVVAGIFTTEVVLLAGVVSAVFGAVMLVANFITYYGVAFDLDYHNAMKNAIEARGNAPVQEPHPAPQQNELQVPQGVGLAKQALEIGTRDMAAHVKARIVDKEKNQNFVYEDLDYLAKSRSGRCLVLVGIPTTFERLEEVLTPEVIKRLRCRSLRAALASYRFNSQSTKQYNWLTEQVKRYHPKGSNLVKEAGNRAYDHSWYTIPQVDADKHCKAYSVS